MRFPLIFFVTILVISSCRKEKLVIPSADDALQLNQIQILASHNSYRLRTTDTVLDFLTGIQSALPANLDPNEMDYTHLPIEEQLNNYGLRGLEIDIYNDPMGGAFYQRRINAFVGLDTFSNIPELLQPGFKVLHIKDVDYNTHFYTFRQCLIALKNWSDQHPGHLPLFINIETKMESPGDVALLSGLGFLPAPGYDASSADALDDEIKSVFGNSLDKIITPDKLRGNLATLEQVATEKKWPKLGECRDKIIFIMQGEMENLYLYNHPNLSGRAMFIYSNPGNNECVFAIRNDPTDDFTEIQNLVQQGYIIRTRTDAGTTQARTGDYTDMNNAFASGAQINSTDYYKPDDSAGQPGWTNFQVKFPNGNIARRNLINASDIYCGEVR